MAYNDDILNAAQRRTRTGRSFFPAANGTYRGINYTLGGQPGANAINSTPQGQTLIGGAGQGYYPQQAIASRPRPNMADYTTIQLPSGGTSRVPTASVGRYLAASPGSTVTQIGNQAPIDRAAAYAKGYGAPTPSVQNFAGGPALVQGGVANPVQNLTPQQRVRYGQGGALDLIKTNPSLNYAVNALGGFGRNIASWFGGGNTPSMPPAAAAGSADYIPRPAGAGNLVPPPALPIPPAPAGINNLVPPNPYVGRQPNEQMFPTGGYGGASQPFPSANPASGTVTMGNEKFPGNMPVPNGNPYPAMISNPIYNPSLPAAQYGARRYSDLGYY